MKRLVTTSGGKALQRADEDDRALAYRTMRRSLPKDLPYTTDYDQVEWVWVGSVPHAVAIFEVTQRRRHEAMSFPVDPPDAYFTAIQRRFEDDGAQGTLARTVARALRCGVWLLVYEDAGEVIGREGLGVQRLWLHDLFSAHGWQAHNQETFTDFLYDLQERTRARVRALEPSPCAR